MAKTSITVVSRNDVIVVLRLPSTWRRREKPNRNNCWTTSRGRTATFAASAADVTQRAHCDKRVIDWCAAMVGETFTIHAAHKNSSSCANCSLAYILLGTSWPKNIFFYFLKRAQSDATELSWHGLVFVELTNGQAGRAHWSLVDAYVSVVTLTTDAVTTLLTVMHYCLLTG